MKNTSTKPGRRKMLESKKRRKMTFSLSPKVIRRLELASEQRDLPMSRILDQCVLLQLDEN
jgi:hypothetical protein